MIETTLASARLITDRSAEETMNIYTSLAALGGLGLIWLSWYAWVITRAFKTETSELERALYQIEQEAKLNAYDWLCLMLSFVGFYQAYREGALFNIVDGEVDPSGFVYVLYAITLLSSFLKKTTRTSQNMVLLHLAKDLKKEPNQHLRATDQVKSGWSGGGGL